MIVLNPIFDGVWNTYIRDSMPIITALIGALGGGLVSGLFVHLLTQSRDREKWILDNKKQEYRELLVALSASLKCAAGTPLPLRQADRERIKDTANEVTRLSLNSIFINKELDAYGFSERWVTAVSSYLYTLNEDPLNVIYNALRDEIVAAANRAVPQSAFQRLMFWKD